jgi:hypothetical protein
MAILVLAAVAAWWTIFGRVDRMIDDIENARSSEEERAAFRAIDRRIGLPLSFEPFDRQGRIVDMSVDRWWESVVMIRISLNGRKVDHTLIDPENIGILMHE